MKIEIDTKHDSPDEIKKVIKMLEHLVGSSSYTNSPNIFEDPNSFGTGSTEETGSMGTSTETPTGNAFANMFGETAREPKEEPMDEPEEKEEKKDDVPEVVPY